MLLPLVTDQLSGQLDDHSCKPDYEACVQLLSTVLDSLDRKDVVRSYCLSLHMNASKIKSEQRGQVFVVEISDQSEFTFLRGSAHPLGQGLKTSYRHPYGAQSQTVVLMDPVEVIQLLIRVGSGKCSLQGSLWADCEHAGGWATY